MIIEAKYDGSLLISDIIEGIYVKQWYMFYTKRQAIAKFKAYCKEVITNEKFFYEQKI